MNHDYLKISLESNLKDELYDLLEGDIIEEIIQQGQVGKEMNFWKMIHEGHSFKITKNLAPRIFKLCTEAKDALSFDEDIDFFIANSPETNAVAVPKFGEESKHLVILNSEIIEKFDDDELKFIIGHEIGHLISDYGTFSRILNFVFPEFKQIPIVFKNKIILWQKLSELTADRYGFIASPNLEKCLSNFFKLASGLDTTKISFNADAYLTETNQLIDKFKKEPYSMISSHPVNPVRIKAIQYFSESDLFKKIKNHKAIKKDDALDKNISELSSLLMVLSNSELDAHRTYFIASAGILSASIDKKIGIEELDHIIDVLGNFTMFPKAFIDNLAQAGDVQNVFLQSTGAILKINPGERFNMFAFLIEMVLADKKIAKEEIEFLYTTGKGVFGFQKKETAQMIGEAIRNKFMPRSYN